MNKPSAAGDGPPSGTPAPTEFEHLAKQPEPSLLAEYWCFLRENKAWWMLPILIVLGLLAFVVYAVATSGAAPFIYPVF